MSPSDDKAWLRQAPAWPLPSGQLRVVDLFAGCGGMSLGFEAAARQRGYAASGLAIEMHPAIALTYATNFPDVHTIAGRVESIIDGSCGDKLTHTEARLVKFLGDVQLVMGGPPCQGHSDLNNHTRRNDPRNQLYLRMARAAEVLQPGVLVVENVPAVIHDASKVVEETVRILEKNDYQVDHGVVSMSRVGVPQARRRHVLIGSRCGVDPTRVLQDVARLDVDGRTVRWAIEDLIDVDNGPLDRVARRSKENEARMKHLFDEDIYDLPNELRPTCHRDKEHTYNAVYGRLHWDRPAPTITTGFTSMGQGRYVHPARQRTITPHEAARLQSFPDWFEWSTERRTLLSTMIGNAVPPLLMARLASVILPDLVDDNGCQTAD